MTPQDIKNRFGIIGGSPLLDHAIRTAMQVAPTEITVLISGESGVGKEVFPQIIHQLSARKHGPYIAVNCGAIPEGTIDSELFGHEKGSFTGAHEARKGYFEVANGGTIFLDEVAELPLSTQVRLLRILETGEFIKVGSSKVLKTNVRIVAASNINLPEHIRNGKFREDLYYRLSTVPIYIPPLRERKEDIPLLFRKFASDFAEKYRMPMVELSAEARQLLSEYRFQGNIRQLKNLTEQLSILEKNKLISGQTMAYYLPTVSGNPLPVLFREESSANPEFSERDLLYKVLFDMKKDVTDLKRIVMGILQGGTDNINLDNRAAMTENLNTAVAPITPSMPVEQHAITIHKPGEYNKVEAHEVVEESLSLADKEIEMIKKALLKYRGKRKYAAQELGISERTLYRKINEYKIEI
jgi:transcriptional regulator with PAS, ATPase and Fis domain